MGLATSGGGSPAELRPSRSKMWQTARVPAFRPVACRQVFARLTGGDAARGVGSGPKDR
ncbi:hypothetical protein X011_02575 [Mycobacterium tuberculosis variant microti OV254]|nr:hypothetical protein X011_02575 [Mycobacterium tuberculosis variant microti OV254]